MSKPIADYGLIGDTHSCALVASDGAIDWLCWPRHDSPAFFTRLLDDANGGGADVRIAGATPAGRRYVDDSAVLETRFAGPQGETTVTDFMPVHPPEPETKTGPDLVSQSRLLRLVTCRTGRARGALTVRFTPDYGRAAAVATQGGDGWTVTGGALPVCVTGSHPIVYDGETLSMAFDLAAGERATLAMTLVKEPLPDPVTQVAEAAVALDRTLDYWAGWSRGLRYDGDYRAAVVRSAITLKLLTYSPTGAIIAAATTSLPEAVPGNRNFDYRYSWVRDASFTVTAFCNVGLVREAGEYVRFLRKADGTHGKDLKLLYAIVGDVPKEQDLAHLPGWREIGPVRIGNAADGQQQHDIYGEFMIALHAYLDAMDYELPEAASPGVHTLIRTLAHHAIRFRDTPDQGIWELRTAAQHFQHSKAMLWTALDRAVKVAEKLPGFAAQEITQWRAQADDLRAEYERESWNPARGAYMQAYGSDVLDAAVLRTVLFGALDPTDPRTLSTLDAIDRELTDGDLVYRYRMDDGLEGREATFTACAFWRVGTMALAGRTAPARALFERLLARGNDLGLFAEEIDAATGEQRGNVPQGFTHMCVINHAVRLESAIARFGFVEG